MAIIFPDDELQGITGKDVYEVENYLREVNCYIMILK